MDERREHAPAASGDVRLEVARAFLEARAAHDYDRAVELFAEDAVWHSPVDGPRRGRGAIREVLVAAERDTDRFGSRVDRIAVKRDRVVAVIVNRGEREGRELDSHQALRFGFRGDRITEVEITVDDPAAVEAFWAD
jgi:ketosteroid isomerase-like protein